MTPSERLLSALADIRHYITHDASVEHCAACPRWNELQDAAMEVTLELDREIARRERAEKNLRAALEGGVMVSAESTYPKYSAVWIVREVRAMRQQREAEHDGWLTNARIDQIEKSLWDYWRSKRAALKDKT